MGSSGENINDMRLYSAAPRMELLENTLKWRNIAPTAPDTLGCYPFQKDDPFIIHQSPHLYFAGNQPEFGTKLLEEDGKQIRVVLVPSFTQTHTAVLVNLDDLTAHPICFSTPDSKAKASS
jgi:DNA polymerase delta subunit 2